MKPNFFGMNIDHLSTLSPDGIIKTSISSKRFWGDGCSWDVLNPQPGVFNAAPLEAWLTAMRKNGIMDGLFVMSRTPPWAAHAETTDCAFAPNTCHPPKDLNPDGTGTNKAWRDWIAFLLRVLPTDMTFHFEPWNEFTTQPNNSGGKNMWTGTNAQMVRLCADLHAAVKIARPDAIVTSPSIPIIGGALNWDLNNFLNYWETPGAQAACDVVAVHPYGPEPAKVLASLQQFKTALGTTKPYWATEGSWGGRGTADTASYVHDWLLGLYWLVDRVYWYAYGPFFAPLVDDKNALTAAGQEWNKVVQSLTGGPGAVEFTIT